LTPAKTGKVGRPFVDALDSKRHDLQADAAFICSNSGFTEDALNKARRKGIGAISVLAAADSRVKVVIEKEIYFRRVLLGERAFTYHGLDIAGLNVAQESVFLFTKLNGKSAYFLCPAAQR
jgi:hypothetical protein